MQIRPTVANGRSAIHCLGLGQTHRPGAHDFGSLDGCVARPAFSVLVLRAFLEIVSRPPFEIWDGPFWSERKPVPVRVLDCFDPQQWLHCRYGTLLTPGVVRRRLPPSLHGPWQLPATERRYRAPVKWETAMAQAARTFGADDHPKCPKCKGVMALFRRTPHETLGSKYERQSFICRDCGFESDRSSDRAGHPHTD